MSDELRKLFQPGTLVPCLILFALLNVLFFPVIWGEKTLIHSAGDASSIMPYGAYEQNRELRQNRRSNDDGAPAWFSEPSYALLHSQYFKQVIPPLWNPYNGYGAPLLANMQTQPFNPLIIIACLAPSPKTDDLFVLARLLLAGILTLLYLRRFVGSYGAIFGAIAYMLTGYMIIFLNMPEISVSMWMPGLLLGLDLLAESITFNRIILSGFFTAMILLGGMPEVAFLELFVGGMYLLCRVICLQTGWSKRYRFFLAYAVSCLIGLGLAAPQILPFLEYVRESSNAHAGTIGAGGAAGPGSVFQQNFPAHFLNYLTPLIYGPLGDAKVRPGFGYDGFNGYWGVISFAFATIAATFAVATGFSRLRNDKDLNKSNNGSNGDNGNNGSTGANGKNGIHDDNNNYQRSAPNVVPVILFFAATALLLLCKKFGAPIVDLAGSLPLFKLIVFWKYSEPIIGFSIATLAAIGFDLLHQGKLQKRTVAIGFSIAATALLAVALYDKRFLWGDHVVHMVFNKILAISLGIIAVAGAVSFGAVLKPSSRGRFCRLLLILLCADLSLSFLLPTFYWFHQIANQKADPYKGAPYISWLKGNLANSERVVGFDGVLFPNWSSAFQISDIRNLDALYPARYLSFVRNFLTESDPTELADFNLTTRFNGMEKLADPLFAKVEQSSLEKLWYLSSVRYLLATRNHFLGKPSEIIAGTLSQSKTEPQFLRLDAFTIDNQTKHVMFQHPRGSQALDSVNYDCTIDKSKPYLDFSIGIDPQVSDIADGDGMSFIIRAIANGKDSEVFNRTIAPKHSEADRHWVSGSVDLSKFAQESVKLVFQVTPGPGTNTSGDWGGWADLKFSAAPSGSEHDEHAKTDVHAKTDSHAETANNAPICVYDKEIKIFKTTDALPRASMFYNATIAKSDKECLEKLKSKVFDVRSTAILDADQIEPAMLPPALPNEPLQAQRLISDTPLAIKVSVSSKHDGLLLLNSQFYPGWTVYVDGKRDEILRADYIFDGVLVKEGQHEVLFQYEPMSFYAGTCAWALTLFSISAYAFFIGRRKSSQESKSHVSFS